MIIFLYLILVIVGLPLWLWLASRISQVSNIGALLSLFLGLPAIYWTVRLWNDHRADLRVPAIANLLVNLIALPLLLFYSAHYATSQASAAAVPKGNPQMARWCKEQNDAIYDPVLEVCVEPGKADALTQEQREHVMEQLEQHLNQHGFAGELDRRTAPEIVELKNMPEIADAASYDFSLLTMSQRPARILLCLSASACEQVAAKAKKDGVNIAIAKGRLLLLITPDSIDGARLKKLKAAMSSFRPAT